MTHDTDWRIRELKEIIREAEQEIYRLEWANKTSYNYTKPCTMPQGHPSHCGYNW